MSQTPDIQELLQLLDDGHLSDNEKSEYTMLLQSLVSAPAKETLSQIAAENETFLEELRVAARTNSDAAMEAIEPEFCKSILERATEQSQCVDVLGGYRILRQLGKGGMGVVFEAEDVQLHRRVAIKTMLPRVATEPGYRERFLKEAQASARVEHDNICPIYQVGQHEGVPFIAMPFLAGESLDSALRRGPFPLQDTLRIGLQIAKGLAAAHAANLIHRDIKPSNIWLEQCSECGPEGSGPNLDRNAKPTRVRILDFGLARIDAEAGQLTETGAILGTPGYMAPEQARSQSVDGRSDLFSLGAVLYEMLTNRRPFSGDNAVSILTSLMVDQPQIPRSVQARIPEELSKLVMKLLAKSPADRPASARAVAEQLSTILTQCSSEPAAAPAVTSVTMHGRARGTSSRFWLGSLVATGLVLAAIAAGVLTLKNENGTLIVHYEGDADVRIKNGAIQIFDANNRMLYALTPSERNRSLPPGKYRVQVKGADGVQLETEEFEMQKSGEFTIRATASPREDSTPGGASDAFDPVVLDPQYFPGQVVVLENFDIPDKMFRPVRPNESVRDHRCTVVPAEDLAKNVLPWNISKGVDAGAAAIRCRGINSDMFLNYATRSDATRFRWLSVATGNGRCRGALHRHDRENGAWVIKQGMGIPTPTAEFADLSSGQWIEFAVRWSKSDFDVWLNGRYIQGGKLPSEELTLGDPAPIQLCAAALGQDAFRFEVDYIGLWDQSGLPDEQRLPTKLKRSPAK